MKPNIALFVYFLFCLPAFADGWQSFEATTTTDVDVRGAPGPYKPILTIPSGTAVQVGACFDEGEWCQVTNNDFSGFIDATLLQVGDQTVQEKYSEYCQGLPSNKLGARKTFNSKNVWTEGDSYMQGAHGVSLAQLIATTSLRQSKDTALGGATLNEIASRLQADENRCLSPRVVVIWDGSPNGIETVEGYVAQMQVAIDGLGHDHFVIIPPLFAGEPTRTDLANEFRARWPDNILDWRDVLGDYGSEIPADWLARPNEDQVHLGMDTMQKMASEITAFIQSKGW